MSTPSTTSTTFTGSSFLDCCATQEGEDDMFEDMLNSTDPSVNGDDVSGFDTHQSLAPIPITDTNNYVSTNEEDKVELVPLAMPNDDEDVLSEHDLSAELEAQLDALKSTFADISDQFFPAPRSNNVPVAEAIPISNTTGYDDQLAAALQHDEV